jgi:hypothetical protein
MDDEFLKKRVLQVRELAEKADPFTKRRLIMLADEYEKQLKKPDTSAPQAPLDKEAWEHGSDERANAAAGYMQHHLMVPQSLAALDQAKIPDQAIVATAHSSQPGIFESPHRASMHPGRNPSNPVFSAAGDFQAALLLNPGIPR